jgi:hypothetical protein
MRVSAGGRLKRASLGREREMMWMIASGPFWVSGTALVLFSFTSPFNRLPGETDADLMAQAIASMTFGGIFLVIAAKIAS